MVMIIFALPPLAPGPGLLSVITIFKIGNAINKWLEEVRQATFSIYAAKRVP